MPKLEIIIVSFAFIFSLFGCSKVVENRINSNPEIVSLTTSSARLGLGQPALIRCVATDSDGDALTYIWESSDGGPLDPVSGAGNEVVYTTHTCCGGMTEITVTVNDGRGGTVKTGLLIEFSSEVPASE
jgi:hypothetical protein